MHEMKAALSEAMADCAAAEAEADELRASHDAVLLSGERRHFAVKWSTSDTYVVLDVDHFDDGATLAARPSRITTYVCRNATLTCD